MLAASTIPASMLYEDDRGGGCTPLLPGEHVFSLKELNSGHDALMPYMMRLLPRLAQNQGLEQGFGTIINTGKGRRPGGLPLAYPSARRSVVAGILII